MAEELRLGLILLGALAIGSVILHGIWTVRRTVNEERKQAEQEKVQQEPEIEPEDQEVQKLKLKQMEMDFATLQQQDSSKSAIPVADINVDSIYQEKHDEPEIDETIDVEEPNFEIEPSVELMAKDDVDEAISDISISSLDSEEDLPLAQSLSSAEEESTDSNKDTQPEAQEVLMLFIDKPEGTPIDGAKLLPTLLTLGFKFGDMDFFHRHIDSAGRGEVLFSLANMYNPGTFDIDNMEQMSTRGLTMFMTLPNAADPLQTFNMMHNAAKKIADEFGATVLNDQRQPIDVLIVRQYVEKIRRFQNA